MIQGMKRVSLEEVIALAEGISQWRRVVRSEDGATYQGDGDGYTMWSSARRTKQTPAEESPYVHEAYALVVQMGDAMVWYRHHALVITAHRSRTGEDVPQRRVEGWDSNKGVNDFYRHVEKITAKE